MKNDLAHFAINADDVQRARTFYEKVLGWKTEPWGPPGFYQVFTQGKDSVRGAIQGRRELLKGQKMVGFECTFAVDDVDKVARAVRDQGGRVLMEKTTITGVGDLIFFVDTEGNVAGAMRYDPGAE